MCDYSTFKQHQPRLDLLSSPSLCSPMSSTSIYVVHGLCLCNMPALAVSCLLSSIDLTCAVCTADLRTLSQLDSIFGHPNPLDREENTGSSLQSITHERLLEAVERRGTHLHLARGREGQPFVCQRAWVQAMRNTNVFHCKQRQTFSDRLSKNIGQDSIIVERLTSFQQRFIEKFYAQTSELVTQFLVNAIHSGGRYR